MIGRGVGCSWLLLTALWLAAPRVSSHTLYQWVVDSRTRFNYDPDPQNLLGVYNWPRTYPSECGGYHQSPVDIQTNFVRYDSPFQCPDMLYNASSVKGKFINNGHSPEFEPETPDLYRLTNVPYRPGTYLMNDVHLHYGGVQGRDGELQGLRFRGSGIMSAGSEHTIDGVRFEGELHFVFYNSKYRNLEEADDKPDGVVVVVILVKKIPDSVMSTMETSRLSEFLDMYIPRISAYQSNISLDLDMTMFFNRTCEFYTYSGSTTTPMCHESVRWIILKEPIMVTERAWFQLTRLVSRGDFNSRFGNYRTTQPLNDRVIEANFPRPEFIPIPIPNGDPRINPESPDVPVMAPSQNGIVPGLNRNINMSPELTMGTNMEPGAMLTATSGIMADSLPPTQSAVMRVLTRLPNNRIGIPGQSRTPAVSQEFQMSPRMRSEVFDQMAFSPPPTQSAIKRVLTRLPDNRIEIPGQIRIPATSQEFQMSPHMRRKAFDSGNRATQGDGMMVKQVKSHGMWSKMSMPSLTSLSRNMNVNVMNPLFWMQFGRGREYNKVMMDYQKIWCRK